MPGNREERRRENLGVCPGKLLSREASKVACSTASSLLKTGALVVARPLTNSTVVPQFGAKWQVESRSDVWRLPRSIDHVRRAGPLRGRTVVVQNGMSLQKTHGITNEESAQISSTRYFGISVVDSSAECHQADGAK
jgi:hypothetical protein